MSPARSVFDAVHLGLYQAALVVTTPHFPYPSAQVSACGDSRIPIRKGDAFAYSCVLSRENDGNGTSLEGCFINRLGVTGSITGKAEYSFATRDMLQHLGNHCWPRKSHVSATFERQCRYAACATDVGAQGRVFALPLAFTRRCCTNTFWCETPQAPAVAMPRLPSEDGPAL
ncbi:hypothetical protein CLU84_2453 [Comamonas sp. 26]|nr:hypothetical protein CLU84_2453 [Comamonas sp. 26]